MSTRQHTWLLPAPLRVWATPWGSVQLWRGIGSLPRFDSCESCVYEYVRAHTCVAPDFHALGSAPPCGFAGQTVTLWLTERPGCRAQAAVTEVSTVFSH